MTYIWVQQGRRCPQHHVKKRKEVWESNQKSQRVTGESFGVFFRWVFIYEKAYQIRDTAIESSVMTKVKGFGVYNDKVMDVADYVTPTQV